MTGSNCRHPRCKRGALPTELIARRDVPIGHFRQASSHHPVPAFGGGEEKSHRLRRLVGQGDKNPATVGWVRLTQEKAVVGHGAYPAYQIGRAHVCPPVTNAHLVCRLLPETNNK